MKCKFTVYGYELKVGETYTLRNKYHHEYEYGEVIYNGTTKNKYGETVYLFSDGTLLDDDDINCGCVCK